jgi:hypothetical protein
MRATVTEIDVLYRLTTVGWTTATELAVQLAA